MRKWGRALVMAIIMAGSSGKPAALEQWHVRSSLPRLDPLSAAAYGDGSWVAVGPKGYIVGSTNGFSWTPQLSGTAHDLNAVAYGRSTFVVAGAAGTILTSTSQSPAWTLQLIDSDRSLRGLTFGHGQFIAVGAGGTVLTSSNGLVWVRRNVGNTNDLEAVSDYRLHQGE